MIKMIGIKRLLMLGILLGINVALLVAYLFVVEPMRSEAQQKSDGISSEISDLQNKIQNTKQDLADFKRDLPKFKELQGKGFMSTQDRFQLSRDLNDVRNAAALAGFSFNVDDIKNVDNAEAKAAQEQLILSRITVDNVTSILDINFYDFIDKMQTMFPAHVRLESFSIERKDPVNQATLQKIAAKQPVSLFTAKASFDWLTMIPLPPPTTPGAPGGQ